LRPVGRRRPVWRPVLWGRWAICRWRWLIDRWRCRLPVWGLIRLWSVSHLNTFAVVMDS
jgi:hypothetical protein